MIYDLIARVLLAFVPAGPERVSGEEAVRWEVGYFTRHRTDLPRSAASRRHPRVVR